MNSERITNVARFVVPMLLAVVCWQVGTPLPTPRALDAPDTAFSAGRADAVLGRLLGDQKPHPVSSAANAAVRERVIAEFKSLGITAHVESARGCHDWSKIDIFSCGTMENILAPIVAGDGPAVVLLAHYDSVAAGPGAGDDMSGVAAILETARALKARGVKSKHPVLALITDGEEAGLLGAAAFLHDPHAKEKIGVVVNVEARGNQGPSTLFQMSAGDEQLVNLYARSAPTPTTSSLATFVYKLMPNDTDLTLFINEKLTAFNFAFSKNVAHYHTPLDTRENLNPASLQHQGDNLLAVASELLVSDFAMLEGKDSIYLAIGGLVVPRMPVTWVVPLSVLTLIALFVALMISKSETVSIPSRIGVLLMPLLLIVTSGVFGWLLHTIAAKVSGHSDPSFAYPTFFRIALSLAMAAMAILFSRVGNVRLLTLSLWGWLCFGSVAIALYLPGVSPYFLFPTLLAVPLVLAQSRHAKAWSGTTGTIVLFLAAIPAVVIWMALARTVEPLQGLLLHPAFTVPVAIAALTLLPVLAGNSLSRRTWFAIVAGTSLAALGAAVLAGLQPAYSAEAPQRLNIVYVDDHIANHARWSMDTPGTLPASVRAAVQFAEQQERAWPGAWSKSFVSDAGATRFEPPTAQATSFTQGSGRTVTLELHGSSDADRIFTVVPKNAGLTRVEIDGYAYVPKKKVAFDLEGTLIGCMTRDCSGTRIDLTFDSMNPVDLSLAELRFALPSDAATLQKARPVESTVQHMGDMTVIVGKVAIP